jgi:hypothetical protein
MHNLVERLKITTGVVLAVLLFTTGLKIEAQAVSIASVTRRVADANRAVVNAAQVKITALSTNAVQSAGTGAEGLYSFPSLPIDDYTLEVTAPGFETYSGKGIGLHALSEFSVETSVLHPVDLVNAVTKSGSNQWHGDVFEFIRNDSVNAVNFFATRQGGRRRTLQL